MVIFNGTIDGNQKWTKKCISVQHTHWCNEINVAGRCEHGEPWDAMGSMDSQSGLFTPPPHVPMTVGKLGL